MRTIVQCLLMAVMAAVAANPPAAAGEAPRENFAGRLEYEGRSAYSHVCVRLKDDVRSLLFVRDSGEEVLETKLNLRKPFVLQFEYLRHLFASYLFRDRQADVLIVGLGGGGMVHFLRRYDPQVRIDAVEIDPLVVSLAEKYFGVRSGENVNIVTGDGLKFIARGEKTYDVIYMDAFLKPSADTDTTGAPLELRTRQFYQQVQRRLKPGGLAMFNLNPHEGLEADVQGIREAFPQTYEFLLPPGQGMVVAASMDAKRLPAKELVRRGKELERRFEGAVRFADMPKRLRKSAALQPAR